MPNQPPDLEKLLRLKRYELPPAGYFEDFLVEFQRRQRAELLHLSSWQLWVERAAARWHEARFLLQPRWVAALGGVAALALTGLFFSGPRPGNLAGQGSQDPPLADNAGKKPPVRTVRVRPIETEPASGRTTTPGVLAASHDQDSPGNNNGLRRTPGSGALRFETIPLLAPVSDKNANPSAAPNSGQVIILVR
ncbi:MAG: hypothetical protein ACR2OZ_03975 [Verrucomicrobiales bacterium]